MKRECKILTLKFVFKNFPVIQEEFKIPQVSKDIGICIPVPVKTHFIITRKNIGWQPGPFKLSAFLPAWLNVQIHPFLQCAFYLSSTALKCRFQRKGDAGFHGN